MIVRTGQMTVAELRDSMKSLKVKVNRDYQRSPRVWPTSAQSYLIETMLKGYPIPKLYLTEITDLRTLKTEREIVDGQQRSMAILRFVEDELRLTTRGEFYGQRFSDLDEEARQGFVEYALGVDLLVGATAGQVREVYRRINSYTTPLNAQEKRFASSSGGEDSVKYVVLGLAERYSEVLVQAKTLTEAKIGRMADQEFIASVIDQLRIGVHTSSPSKLNKLYDLAREQFPAAEMEQRIIGFFDWLEQYSDLYGAEIMAREQMLTLAVAQSHVVSPLPSLTANGIPSGSLRPRAEVRDRLGELDEGLQLELESVHGENPLKPFLVASAEATNTAKNRLTRVGFYARAICSNA